MRFLLVSDVHKTYKIYKGRDESVAVKWLLRVINRTNPDVLISAGDWDEGMSQEDFAMISSKVELLTVYGNHENFQLIKSLAMPDGKVFLKGGLKIAGINGLIEENEKKAYSITREQFINAVYRIERNLRKLKERMTYEGEARYKDAMPRLDILVTHHPPYIPEIYPYMTDEYGRLVFDAVERLKPRLFLNGHMKGGCYSYYQFPSGTKYIRVDSSQSFRCYGVLESEENRVTVYDDGKEEFSFDF